MTVYSPPGPWDTATPSTPVEVTDEFGNDWLAIGPNQLKKPQWEPPVFDNPEDCCTYVLTSTATLVEGEITAIVGAPSEKTDGDTAFQKHPNGFSVFECQAGGWALQWVCIIPESQDPIIPDEPGKETFKAGEVSTVPTANEIAYLTTAFTLSTIAIGSTVMPSDMLGCVQIDETDGTAAYYAPPRTYFDCEGNPVTSASRVLTLKQVPTNAQYAGANPAGHDESQGLPIGKNAAGLLVSQPPLPVRRFRTAIDTAQNFSPVLDDIVAAGGGPSLGLAFQDQTLAELQMTLRNDTCWPMIFKMTARVNIDMDMVPGNRWRLEMLPKQAFHWMGAPWDGRETSFGEEGAGPNQFEQYAFNLFTAGQIALNPGQTFVLDMCLRADMRYYTPGAENRLIAYGFRMQACGHAAHSIGVVDQTASTQNVFFI